MEVYKEQIDVAFITTHPLFLRHQYAVTPVNFTSLREHAVADILVLAPDSWIDHTTSDPGITMLEQIIAQFTRAAEHEFYKLFFDIRYSHDNQKPSRTETTV